MINAARYLAGGTQFDSVLFANITPDCSGLPAGLTSDRFVELVRTGVDPEDGQLLQVMPWPIYRNLEDLELRAIYEYLSAIPHVEPGP